jgi:hypothetical protein
VAALCGPDASYADSTLPNAIFEEFSIQVMNIEHKELGILKPKVEDGSLLNATFLRRFALEMLEKNWWVEGSLGNRFSKVAVDVRS